MGATISASTIPEGRRRSEAASISSSMGTKGTSTKAATRASEEVAGLPHVMSKAEESVSASCALSHTASMPDVTEVGVTCAGPAQVSPINMNLPSPAPPAHPSAAAEAHPILPCTPKEATASLSMQQQQQQRHSLRTSHSPTNVSTPMYGVDVVRFEHTSPHSADLPGDLDDFELAYSRGVQYGNIPAAAVAAESFAVVQYIRPLPRPASHNTTGVGMSFSGISRSFSAPELAITYPPLYTPSDVDETVAFVTLRRSGFSVCSTCESDLPYKAKFCPECGACVEASNSGSSSSHATRTTSAVGSLCASSLIVAPHSDSCNNSSMSTPAGATLHPTHVMVNALEESNVFNLQRRHAFVRYVKVLRSRGMLGVGTSGTVYRAIDTRTGQQLAVKESLINQNSPDELAAVRNELRQLAELRHPYIVEYFGCRVEAVDDTYVSYLQSSMISSHASAAESRRGSRRNSVASPRATSLLPVASRTASEADEAAEPRRVEERRRNAEAPAAAALPSPTKPHRRKSVASSTIRVLALMGRVECGTLNQLLADFPRGLPEQAVRRFASQLVDAVRYVHACGLSHRDVKPDNILLAADGTIRLTDFGCAVRGVNGLTGNGIPSIAGTPAYMPPESLACLGRAAVDWTFQGKAQDVWAIGCVVHHLLTAETPWSAMKPLNPYALLLHIQAHEFPLNTHLLSRDAQDFCRHCFERDPQRRITAAELATHPFVSQTKHQSRSASLLCGSQRGCV